MRLVTLENLIGRARLAADNQNQVDLTIIQLINDSATDFRDMLTRTFGDEYLGTTATLVTTANVDAVALPDDFYKLTSIWWIYQNQDKVRLTKYMENESESRPYVAGWTGSWPYCQNVKYRLSQGTVRFVPTPTQAYTLMLHYVPTLPLLDALTDTLDGYNGFDEWVVLDVASKLLQMEGNDQDDAMVQQRKSRLEMRISDMADRDYSEPAKIQDTRPRGGTRFYWR